MSDLEKTNQHPRKAAAGKEKGPARREQKILKLSQKRL